MSEVKQRRGDLDFFVWWNFFCEKNRWPADKTFSLATCRKALARIEILDPYWVAQVVSRIEAPPAILQTDKNNQSLEKTEYTL